MRLADSVRFVCDTVRPCGLPDARLHMRESCNDLARRPPFRTRRRRPHPWAPNKPPLNLIANPMTAPLDGLADMWRFAGNPPQ